VLYRSVHQFPARLGREEQGEELRALVLDLEEALLEGGELHEVLADLHAQAEGRVGRKARLHAFLEEALAEGFTVGPQGVRAEGQRYACGEGRGAPLRLG